MLSTVQKPVNYTGALNRALRFFFKDALIVSLTNPAYARYFLETAQNQQKAASLRAKWKRRGLHVPPLMIMSVTNRCNLHCRGCYNQALRDTAGDEMSEPKLRATIAEAKDLGISFIVLAGGEPLVRPEIMDIARDFPEIVFLVFTNGLLIDELMTARLKTCRNIIPLISLESFESETDLRRGRGVFAQLTQICHKLNQERLFYGTSITLTSTNFDTVTDAEFIRFLAEAGSKMFFFVEYTAVQPGTEDWLISDAQRRQIAELIKDYRSRFPALFVAVPGDEKEFGGCLAAARGFIHISAEGALEPCPFVPYSDANLRDLPLKDALQSRFLKVIRENVDNTDPAGGCALLSKKEWLEKVLSESSSQQ